MRELKGVRDGRIYETGGFKPGSERVGELLMMRVVNQQEKTI